MIHFPVINSLRERVPALLQAIPGDDPTGSSLRGAVEIDLLQEARRADDTDLPQGVWAHELKRADWVKVEIIAEQLLTLKSKDAKVAGWLGEAWSHQYGPAGYAVALELLHGLLDRYGTRLYPRAPDDSESWLEPALSWVVQTFSKLLISGLPLLGTAVPANESLTLDQWARAHQQVLDTRDDRKVKARVAEAQAQLDSWQESVLRVPRTLLVEYQQILAGAAHKLGAIARCCDTHLSNESPSFSGWMELLERHINALQTFIDMHPAPAPVVLPEPTPTPEATVVPAPDPVAATQATSIPMGVPQSRDAAYEQLKVIAAYLAQVERHSPVPYLIERAVEWGEMPLHELLGHLINADVDTRRIWTVLGVLP